MRGMLSVIRSSITHPTLLDSHPLRIHALASTYNWDEVAQASAMRCLDHDLTALETTNALRGTSLDHYGRLMSLAQRRHRRFREILDDPASFNGSHPDYLCKKCGAPARDLTWKILRMRLVDEFAKCTSGAAIISELDGWPEWDVAMSASHCPSACLYHTMSTYQEIVRSIQSLPTELIVPRRITLQELRCAQLQRRLSTGHSLHVKCV